MTLFHLFQYASFLGWGLVVLGFICLIIEKQMQSVDLSPEEKKEIATRGLFPGLNDRYGKRWFWGKPWAMSFSAEISTYDLLKLMKEGKWKKAYPYAITALGTIITLFFFPGFIFMLGGPEMTVPGIAISLFFAYSTIKAAWPRIPGTSKFYLPWKE